MALNVLVTEILSALGHKVTGSFPLLLITSTTTPGDLNSCLGESKEPDLILHFGGRLVL